MMGIHDGIHGSSANIEKCKHLVPVISALLNSSINKRKRNPMATMVRSIEIAGLTGSNKKPAVSFD